MFIFSIIRGVAFIYAHTPVRTADIWEILVSKYNDSRETKIPGKNVDSHWFNETTSRFMDLGNFTLNFSSSTFVIRVYLQHNQGRSVHIRTYARAYSWYLINFFWNCLKTFFSLNLVADNFIFVTLYWRFFIISLYPSINHSVLANNGKIHLSGK